jgi:hypothetical protein
MNIPSNRLIDMALAYAREDDNIVDGEVKWDWVSIDMHIDVLEDTRRFATPEQIDDAVDTAYSRLNDDRGNEA